jgi:hypothetical protein
MNRTCPAGNYAPKLFAFFAQVVDYVVRIRRIGFSLSYL